MFLFSLSYGHARTFDKSASSPRLVCTQKPRPDAGNLGLGIITLLPFLSFPLSFSSNATTVNMSASKWAKRGKQTDIGWLMLSPFGTRPQMVRQ